MINSSIILIVEDDDNLRFLTIRQLKKLGFACHFASDGLEALDMVSRQKYDLILMDVMMPKLDGYEATRKIRIYQQEKQQNRTPIVGMTAYGTENTCIEAGMDAYLPKPVLLPDLQLTLESFLTDSESPQ